MISCISSIKHSLFCINNSLDFIWWNITGILRSNNHVRTTVWLHHLEFNEMPGDKAWWELCKDAVCYFEQILEAVPYRTAVV